MLVCSAEIRWELLRPYPPASVPHTRMDFISAENTNTQKMAYCWRLPFRVFRFSLDSSRYALFGDMHDALLVHGT